MIVGAGKNAPEYLPKEYGLTQEYLSLRIWEVFHLPPVEQEELSPGDLATLVEYVLIRMHEEARLVFASR